MVKNIKFDVDISSGSLKKLKQTFENLEVSLDESAVKELNEQMIDLGGVIADNTVTIRDLIEKFRTGGGGVGIGDTGAPMGGSSKILEQIRDMLADNGARLKSLADINEGGINEAAHTRLKQLSRAQMILDDQLKTKRIWMRAIVGGGGGQSGIMRALQGAGGAIFGKLSESVADVYNYQQHKGDIKQETGGATGGMLSPDQKKGIAGNYGIQGDLDKVSKRAEGRMGKVLGKLGGGKGMKMAGAVGLGALGLASLAKKGFQALIESSPMLKQMMKMLNFGVMMILRPIGDFFGFFLRPIFVYLLRKFIIPFYQTYLPIMQTLGTQLGEYVVGWFTWAGAILEALGWEKKKAGSGNVPDAAIQAAQLKEMEKMKQEGASQTEIANRMLEGVTTGGYVTDPDPSMTKFGTKLPELVNQSADNMKIATTGITSTAEALEAIKEQPTIGTLGGSYQSGTLDIGNQPITTSSSGQFQSHFQQAPPEVKIEINVEGNMDNDTLMDLEPKMEEVADQVVRRVYNMDNRR